MVVACCYPRKKLIAALLIFCLLASVYVLVLHAPDPDRDVFLSKPGDGSGGGGGKAVLEKLFRPMAAAAADPGASGSRTPDPRVRRPPDNKTPLPLVHFPEHADGDGGGGGGDGDWAGVRAEQRTLWAEWLKGNPELLSVGKYFTRCENGIQMGELVTIPNKNSWHGFSVKSIVNFTLTDPVETGILHVDVSFNGLHFLKTSYELCRKLRRHVPCPLTRGPHFVESRSELPFFALKGKYNIKIWGENEKHRPLGCLLASIVI